MSSMVLFMVWVRMGKLGKLGKKESGEWANWARIGQKVGRKKNIILYIYYMYSSVYPVAHTLPPSPYFFLFPRPLRGVCLIGAGDGQSNISASIQKGILCRVQKTFRGKKWITCTRI